MTPERWRKIESIFQTVIEKPKPERQMMLTQYCGEDTELRREVEALLSEDETNDVDDFIQAPIKDVAQSLPTLKTDNYIGRDIGSYHIVKILGQGGMGAVYLAERADAEYYRQVALKIVRRGMDSSFVLKRFRVERQILATLEHPNIAQLLDGGSTKDGLPYFVMEYVQGQPLTEYCNTQQLSLADRLKLFLPVCAAVQHAHQKLIVHRDLKPSNILVTTEGTPKLLDFGIAKLLDPTLSPTPLTRTQTSMRLMTPDYASPEQVRGLPITAASDVYSLGVVLYELLTGARPYQFDTYSPAEIERAICDTEVERPSALAEKLHSSGMVKSEDGKPKMGGRFFHHSSFIPRRSSLRGDLDNIVLMALRKEPERRYQSVEQLAKDIRCYLEGRPISARRESAIYRTGKFVRRNKLAVTAAGLVFFSLLGGIVTTTRAARIAQTERTRAEANLVEAQTQRAEADRQRLIAEQQRAEALTQRERAETEAAEANLQRELAEAQRAEADAQRKNAETQQERAERRFAQVRKLANTFLFDFHDQIQTLAGATAAREMVVKTALEYLDSLTKDAENDPSLLLELAAAYTRVGDVQGAPDRPNLGQKDAAKTSYQRSIELGEKLRSAGRTDVPMMRALALAYSRMGELTNNTGDKLIAQQATQKSMEIANRVLATGVKDDDFYYILAIGNHVLGNLENNRGNELGALSYSQSEADASDRWLKEMGTPRARVKSSQSFRSLGDALRNLGRLPEARENLNRALALQNEICQLEPNNVDARLSRASTYYFLGKTVHELGELKEALAYHRQALNVFEEVAAKDPKNASVRSLLRFQASFLGAELLDSDPAQAVEVLNKSLQRGSDERPIPPQYRIYQVFTYLNLARGHWLTGNRAEAEKSLQEAQSLLRAAPAKQFYEMGIPLYRVHNSAGLVLLEMGEIAPALTHLQQALQLGQEYQASHSNELSIWNEMAEIKEAFGKYQMTLARRSGLSAEQSLQHWREARDWYQQSLTFLQEWGRRSPGNTQSVLRARDVSKQIAQCDTALTGLAAKQQR